MHAWDCDGRGFGWSVVDDRANSIFAWLRYAEGGAPMLALSNFTPVPRYGYRVGVSHAGPWREILNTDSTLYGGSNVGNAGCVTATAEPYHGLPASLSLTVPPLATLLLRLD